MRRSRFLGLCLLVGIVSLSLALYLLYDLVQRRRASVLGAKEAARQQAVTAASEIGAELRKLEAIVHGLAEEVTSSELSDREVGNRLTGVMEGSPQAARGFVRLHGTRVVCEHGREWRRLERARLG
jgi:hypothetical protein